MAARRVAIVWEVAMETGNISKPVAPAAPAAPRVDQLLAAGAVKTELAPEAAVQQAGDAPAVRYAPNDGADFSASLDVALREVVERNITVDPRTRELVFQTISKETGEVVRQIPDEAMLRLRAYVREMQEAEEKGRSGSDVPRVEKVA
jgi:flagellar protein FlaG